MENRALPKRVPAITSAVAILRYLQGRPHDPVTLAEIVRALRLNRSTCFNLLKTMQDEGVLAYDSLTKRYRLGHTLLGLGLAVARELDAVAVALPYLQALVQEIELVGLVILRTPDEHFLVVHKVESRKDVKVTIALGERLPPNAPLLSRAYLAWQADPVVDAFLARWGLAAFTPQTVTDPARYRDNLARIRERGYAVTQGEYILHLNAIAAPVFDADGQVALLLCTLAFRSELNEEQFADFGAKLRQVAEHVTTALGGRCPASARVGVGTARSGGATGEQARLERAAVRALSAASSTAVAPSSLAAQEEAKT